MNKTIHSRHTMDNQYKHIVLTFDRAEQPKYEEKKGKGYIEYGADNDYPKYLLSLFNESPKHGAIVKSKCTYIYGKGWDVNAVCNSYGETWNTILRKAIQDDELYRGFYLQVIWNRIGKIGEVHHLEFHKVRVSKDLTKFYVKNDWKDFKEKPREYDAYNPTNPVGSQIYYFKEYNPSCDYYPMPSYFQGLNYICSDIEVSRHILGNARQGFVGSTLINLNNGDPINEEHRGEVEKGLLKKFTGDAGRRVVIMFNKSRDNAAEIQNLGNTMLTKEDFTNINNLIQQEIFASHQVVSPSLMGIKTEGQLGSRNEIRDAYEIFNNTYVTYRQNQMEEIFNTLRTMKGEAGEFKIVPVEPLKFEFSESIMSANLTQNEIREIMGKEPLENTQVTSDGQLAVQDEIKQVSNDAIKNLTGRQHQNVMRIVRQFTQGKLTKAQASLMLKNGFGFTDTDINTFLGIDDDPMTDDEIQQFSMDEDDKIVTEFSQCGEEKKNYEIIESKNLIDMQYFAIDLNQASANIIDLMTKDQNITPEVLARTLKLDISYVKEIIKELTANKIIDMIPSNVNESPKYKVLKPVSELGGKNAKTTTLVIRYSYEGPKDDRNRLFCRKMLQLSESKMWSRSDIESISERLGYSVWDRRGGWYTEPDGSRRPYCRHRWVSHLVKKKQ